jgi:GNAT superfamily N-acetyltransferase
LRPGGVDDEQSPPRLFDEAVLWLVDRGLSGQWGDRLWSVRPEAKELVSNLAASPGLTIAEVDQETVGALVVSEDSPSYAPAAQEQNLYIVLLLTSRRFAGQRIGEALLHHARKDCVDRGLSLLRVDCWAGGSRRLVEYYQSAGFAATASFDKKDGQGSSLCSA